MKSFYLTHASSAFIIKHFFLLLFLVTISVSYAQDPPGTVVITKKALSQVSPGVDFNFYSEFPLGGSIVLNDDQSFIPIQDVAIARNNTIWVIAATSSGTGNGTIYYRKAGSSSWVQTSSSGARIDVTLNGRAAMINEQGFMFLWADDTGFVPTTSATIGALDIGASAGAIQNVFVLAKTNTTCNVLKRYTGIGQYTTYSNICGNHLDVSPDGSVYVLNESAKEVYKVTFSADLLTATINQTYKSGTLSFKDITVAADGSIWAVDETHAYRLTGGIWVVDPKSGGVGSGVNGGGISAGYDGDTPLITYNARSSAATPSRGQLSQRREDGSWLINHAVRASGASNSVTFNVSPGTYRLDELTNQPAWKLVAINNVGGSVKANLDTRRSDVTVRSNETVYVEYVNVGYDFGDAPDSYGTTAASNGPFHQVNTSLILGSTIDIDQDGIAGAADSDDDNNSVDDEDAVSAFAVISGGSDTKITNYIVNVTGINKTAAAANLCGWIDWNNNGIFETTEGVCTKLAPSATMVTLTWPTATLTGANGKTGVYARFRLTTDMLTAGNANGAAEDGEVEDYFITFTNPLPVKLITFDASAREQHVELTWSTTEETNADRFDIENSRDGKIWNHLGSVSAKGESSVRINYSFTHPDPLRGQNLYRLKMIDSDNTFAYSKMVGVDVDIDRAFTAYPNPVTDRLNISDYQEVRLVQLHNAAGLQILKTQKLSPDGIDVTVLPQGIYTLTITRSDGSNSRHKLLISR